MSVTVERDDHGVAVLTFADPPLNLYSGQMHADFDAALGEVEDHPPRALLIRADGKIVSGGVDVSEFRAAGSQADLQELFDRMLDLPERIARLDVPTFFAAHALTLTWALEVALACDILIASEQAKFGLVERVIGLTPTMGGTQRFAARAGVARAKEFVFTGELYDAATLERWSVINRVLPDDGFDDAVTAIVHQVAVGPTKAFGAAKQILRHLESGGLQEAHDHTTAIAAGLFDTDDLQGGIDSFLSEGPGKATFNGA
jgi:enoyl-CoA hydratase/carnithine racemase